MNQQFIMNRAGAFTLSLALLTTIVLVVTAQTDERQEALLESNTLAEDKAVEAAQLHTLIREMSDGSAEGVRGALSVHLAKDLVALRGLLPGTDAWTRLAAERLIQEIMDEERKHPDYYLTSTPKIRAGEMKSWGSLNEPFPRVEPASMNVVTK